MYAPLPEEAVSLIRPVGDGHLVQIDNDKLKTFNPIQQDQLLGHILKQLMFLDQTTQLKERGIDLSKIMKPEGQLPN